MRKYFRVTYDDLDARLTDYEREWGFKRRDGYGQLGKNPTPARAMAYGGYAAVRDMLEEDLLPMDWRNTLPDWPAK